MNAEQVAMVRSLLAPTGFLERAAAFAASLRRSPRAPGGLLLVGTQTHEPWHLAAHLSDESRRTGIPELAPTLVRWSPPPGAPAHLSTGLSRLEHARRGEAVLVVTPDTAPDPLLERVADARRVGATILALDCGDEQLDSLAHEALTVGMPSAPVSFDAAQHLVSAAAGQPGGTDAGWRSRLARVLDIVSGPVPSR